MATPHTKTLSVEEAQKQFDAARLALGAAKKAQFEKIKNQFSDDFLDAAKSFADIPEEDRAYVWNDKKLVKVAAKIGLQPIDKPSAEPSEAGDGAPVARYDKTAILAFVGAGKLQSEVEKHFNTTKTSVIDWGKRLVADGSITIGKAEGNKRSNFWKPKI